MVGKEIRMCKKSFSAAWGKNKGVILATFTTRHKWSFRELHQKSASLNSNVRAFEFDLHGCCISRWCGELTFGPRNTPGMTSVEENLRSQGGKWHRLSSDRLRSKFPTFRFDADTIGILDEEAGIIQPDKCLHAFRVKTTSL